MIGSDPARFIPPGFDGSLRASPWVDGIGPADFSLHRFAIDEWGGFAFVRLASDGPSAPDPG
jgi:hypothetical protein